MIMAELTLNISSHNGNGLKDRIKRVRILKWLKKEHNGIFLLQETHSVKKKEGTWNNDIENRVAVARGLKFSSLA